MGFSGRKTIGNNHGRDNNGNSGACFRFAHVGNGYNRYRRSFNITIFKDQIMEIDYIYIDENGLTVTRLKPQKTVEEYRAHSGGLFDDDALESIEDLTGE